MPFKIKIKNKFRGDYLANPFPCTPGSFILGYLILICNMRKKHRRFNEKNIEQKTMLPCVSNLYGANIKSFPHKLLQCKQNRVMMLLVSKKKCPFFICLAVLWIVYVFEENNMNLDHDTETLNYPISENKIIYIHTTHTHNHTHI